MILSDIETICNDLERVARALIEDGAGFGVWSMPLILENFLRGKYLGIHKRIEWDEWEGLSHDFG